MGSALTAMGISVPRARVDNSALGRRLGIDPAWIEARTGIETRHVAGPHDSTATLAAAAGRAACTAAGVDPADIDLVIVATVTPDLVFPSAAALVQAELRAGHAGAYDLNAGCAGFLYALAQADALVSAGSARRVLVCGADVLTRITDYEDPKSSVLFGDGAGAVVVERSRAGHLGPFLLRADGTRPELLWVPPDTGKIAMSGREVYRAAVEGMASAVEELLAATGLSAAEIDLVVAHQANARILEAVANRTGIARDRVVLNIARYGNTSAASIPLALAEAQSKGMLHEGARVVLTAFGAGFAWGAGLVSWVTAPSTADRLLVGDARA